MSVRHVYVAHGPGGSTRSQQQRTQGRSACGGAVQSWAHGVLLVNRLQEAGVHVACRAAPAPRLACLLMSGRTSLRHFSRHCLQVRPGTCLATSTQSGLAPTGCTATTAASSSSSSRVHAFARRRDAAEDVEGPLANSNGYANALALAFACCCRGSAVTPEDALRRCACMPRCAWCLWRWRSSATPGFSHACEKSMSQSSHPPMAGNAARWAILSRAVNSGDVCYRMLCAPSALHELLAAKRVACCCVAHPFQSIVLRPPLAAASSHEDPHRCRPL